MIARLPAAGAGRAVETLGGIPQAVATVLQLAQGRPIVAEACDWTLLFGIALQERCAVLAWTRSAAVIRSQAPAEVITRWRAHALERQAYAERQLRALERTITALQRAGVAPVVLKGLPLAARLYGDFGARACVDMDLFVHAEQRPAAAVALSQLGWSLAEGEAPWTQSFVSSWNGERFDLEVHSSIVDLNLRHLEPAPPRSAPVTVGSAVLPALRDPIEPAYLAAHAAKHMPAALLYHVDFAALWSGLSVEERRSARSAAADAGLAGYLDWMLERSSALEPATAGDRRALRRLGIGSKGRIDTHAAFRDAFLARSPLAAIRSITAWIWPPNLRPGWGPFLSRCRHRLRAPWRRYLAKGDRYRAVRGR